MIRVIYEVEMAKREALSHHARQCEVTRRWRGWGEVVGFARLL